MQKLQNSESSQSGYDYIEGENEGSAIQSVQDCCGNIIGFCKGWCPCIGCFCYCCPHPYATIQQGNKGLLLRYSKYVKTVPPGLIYINPVTEMIVEVDCRITVVDLPKQSLMTKDNIPIAIDSCVYYHIENPHLNYFRMTELNQSVTKVCGGIIKNTVASFTFQDLLEKREDISQNIEEQIDPVVKHWGVDVNKIFLKDFGINSQLERELVSASVAKRDAESKILSAQGDVQVAKRLNNKSKILDTPTAIQVRYLETIKSLSKHKNTKMIYTAY